MLAIVPPSLTDESESPEWFATTRWSTVLAARDAQSPRGAEALEQLCRRYWPPV